MSSIIAWDVLVRANNRFDEVFNTWASEKKYCETGCVIQTQTFVWIRASGGRPERVTHAASTFPLLYGHKTGLKDVSTELVIGYTMSYFKMAAHVRYAKRSNSNDASCVYYVVRITVADSRMSQWSHSWYI